MMWADRDHAQRLTLKGAMKIGEQPLRGQHDKLLYSNTTETRGYKLPAKSVRLPAPPPLPAPPKEFTPRGCTPVYRNTPRHYEQQ